MGSGGTGIWGTSRGNELVRITQYGGGGECITPGHTHPLSGTAQASTLVGFRGDDSSALKRSSLHILSAEQSKGGLPEECQTPLAHQPSGVSPWCAAHQWHHSSDALGYQHCGYRSTLPGQILQHESTWTCVSKISVAGPKNVHAAEAYPWVKE